MIALKLCMVPGIAICNTFAIPVLGARVHSSRGVLECKKWFTRVYGRSTRVLHVDSTLCIRVLLVCTRLQGWVNGCAGLLSMAEYLKWFRSYRCRNQKTCSHYGCEKFHWILLVTFIVLSIQSQKQKHINNKKSTWGVSTNMSGASGRYTIELPEVHLSRILQ